jgi:hypothetical protein
MDQDTPQLILYPDLLDPGQLNGSVVDGIRGRGSRVRLAEIGFEKTYGIS